MAGALENPWGLRSGSISFVGSAVKGSLGIAEIFFKRTLKWLVKSNVIGQKWGNGKEKVSIGNRLVSMGGKPLVSIE